VRHAIAVDEKRYMFVNNTSNSTKNNLQMWFPGVHTDVGGGQREEESQLSKIALQWMLDEAIKAGLKHNEEFYRRYLGANPAYSKPNSDGKIHTNGLLWYILNFFPRYKKISYRPSKHKFFFPLLRYREIPEHHKIHQSVLDRMDKDSGYQPSNVIKWFEKR